MKLATLTTTLAIYVGFLVFTPSTTRANEPIQPSVQTLFSDNALSQAPDRMDTAMIREWLEPALIQAGWLRKSEKLTDKNLPTLGLRVCTELLEETMANCLSNDEFIADALFSLSRYVSLSGKDLPKSVFTANDIRLTMKDDVLHKQKSGVLECPGIMSDNWEVSINCLTIQDNASRLFPRITKLFVEEQLRKLEKSFLENTKDAARINTTWEAKELRKEFETNTTNDIQLVKDAIKKRNYAAAFVTIYTLSWSLYNTDKNVSNELFATKYNTMRSALRQLEKNHLKRSSDSAYLQRYGQYKFLLQAYIYIQNNYSKSDDGKSNPYSYNRLQQIIEVIELIDKGSKVKLSSLK